MQQVFVPAHGAGVGRRAIPLPDPRRLLTALLVALAMASFGTGMLAIWRTHGSVAAPAVRPGPQVADRPEMSIRGHYPDAPTPASAAESPGDSRAAMTTTSAQPEQPVAWLTIPRLGLAGVPIFDRGLNASRQMLIAGGYSITHYQYSGALGGPSNAVLYGHDDIEGGVFGGLSRLRVGDNVEVRRADGTAVTYRVRANPAYVAPSAVNILDATAAPQLTLFSCYPLWVDTQRVVVVATPA
jgi:LPXTG-site transpeptidase (sortase) family protein